MKRMFSTEVGRPDDAMTHPGWWAVYTRHHHEQTVTRMLTAKGLDVFLPTFETPRQWKDRKKIISMPLFPSYLFVRHSADARLPVLTTPGVHMILTRDGQCAVIPDDEIRAIKQAVQDPSRIKPHQFLNCGEQVRLLRGPLQGVQGILIRKKGACRLVVGVELLNQSAAVEVNSVDVEPLVATTHFTYFTSRTSDVPLSAVL
jgi:transcription antitermination factor NusG